MFYNIPNYTNVYNLNLNINPISRQIINDTVERAHRKPRTDIKTRYE